jgi:uncharacterized repeat protein (TIGR03803 family)
MEVVSRPMSACRAGLFVLAVPLLFALRARAQSYTVLYAFTGTDGLKPNAGLVQGTDGSLYGTTYSGGLDDKGTVFRITVSGTLATLHSFSGIDGANPGAALVQGTDGNFYGTTQQGGANGSGTVFRITPSGTLTPLHSFAGGDGEKPLAALVQGSDGNFYGTTSAGGTYGSGTVFGITPSGALTTLHSFTGSDGADPEAGLVQGADGSFYGTTNAGVSSGHGNGYGTVFRITPTGVLTTIHSFAGSDGFSPQASLIQGSDGNLYGTTSAGGDKGIGTVFRITPGGVLTTLYSFAGSDGQAPTAALVQATDGNFYGTTAWGGASGLGTVFEVTPAGATTRLYSFPGNVGSIPNAALVEGTDGSFYGTASAGGWFGGVVFRLTHDPVLFLPVVLDNVAGVAGSRYTTEMTLASKAAIPVQVDLKYTASVGSGTGSISVSLAPGETRVIPNAISFLRSQGLAIPSDGAAVGTLLATFVGASLSDGPFIGGRTYTAGGGGTFGVFYPAATTTTLGTTLVGLQQNSTQRSNLALANAGATPVTLRVQLFGPMGEDLGTLPDQSLPPYGWTQINAPLEGKAASGQAVVTQVTSPITVTGTSPFTAYAVLNDAVTSDGSFIPPLVFSAIPPGDLLVPVVLDVHGIGGSHYTTELTLTNFATSSIPVTLVYTASLGSGSGQATLTLAPLEQKIVPDAIAFLRSQGLAIPEDGSSVGGSLLVSPALGAPISTFAVGARTFTPTSSGGTLGVYYPGLTLGDSAASVAFVNGLQQNSSQRSNLALVNRGDASDAITLSVSFFDGTGAALGAPTEVVLAPGQWTQFSQPLQVLGATSGYAKIKKASGGSRFVAYGVLNDAVTSDGSYIPMSF